MSVSNSFVGLLLSYHLRVPSGAVMVLTAVAAFAVAGATRLRRSHAPVTRP